MSAASRRALLATPLAAAALLTLAAGPAAAALTHPVQSKFPSGCSAHAGDVAVDESAATVYVMCNDGFLGSKIKKFDLDGNPVDFSGSAPYISANAITGDPGNPPGYDFDQFNYIDVSNAGADRGDIFVSAVSFSTGGSGNIDVFGPDGKFLTALTIGGGTGGGGDENGVGVGPDGSVYVSINQGGGNNRIAKYSPSLQPVEQLLVHADGVRYVRADSTGAIWLSLDPGEAVVKFEADQLISSSVGTNVAILGLPFASPSPFAPNPLLSSLFAFDVDPTNDDLYVNRGNRIEPYSRGDAAEPAHQNGPTFGSGKLNLSSGIAVTADRHVYASTDTSVVIFSPGLVVPDVVTPAPQVDDVGHTAVALHAILERAGGPPIGSCQLQYGPDSTYTGSGSGTVACTPDPGSSFSDPSVPVTGTIPGLTTGATYHYRVKAANANGTNFGLDRTVTPAAVIKLRTLAADGIDTHGATLEGSSDPDGFPSTAYRFEYGLDTGYGQSTATVDEGPSSGVKHVSIPVSGLPAGRTFHYRILATNSLGTTVGEDMTFRTASPPEVSGVRATDVTADSAVLHARIDPVGYPTTYRFEYGTSTQYGNSIPAPTDGSAGDGNGPHEMTAQISGLQAGVTYHFRVLATNAWGTGASEDTTFDFFPPSCPNAQVRQQTHAGFLPDCRAYELVSPADAGAVLLFPSDELFLFFPALGVEAPPIWPVNRGQAGNPSRFAYIGGAGAITGIDPPNGILDMYMATRTTAGWFTSLPGLNGHQALFVAEKECSDSLDRCIDHNQGDEFGPDSEAIAGRESAPYLFTAAGAPLGRLPTNVDVIPGGRLFSGDQRLSGDFSHFVFSSNGTKFAPDGVKEAPGSAYDNEIAGETVTTISRLAGGGPIPGELDPLHNPDEHIEFPAISTDGSHVLMQVNSSDGGASIPDGRVHLYMRVDDAITYDVSRGHGVTFVAMSADGTKVYFLARQQLGDGDTDGSTDLYLWEDAGGADTLTRVARGNGQGNSDLCASSWDSGCDVAALSTERAHPFDRVSATGSDDLLARASGDLYFYSPEVLDPDRPGIPNQRNLYLYRDGAPQLVATLDPGARIERIQISPDGRHAAFLTTSRLTGYDSRGLREMYAYDADTGAIRCASCRPDGLPPAGDVAASEGGPFMTDDGRTFFTTPDSLVPQDSNGTVRDVYEYVDGRPQLISAGTGSRDFTGGSPVGSIYGGVHTGLESVSADGTDVFFSTFDSLVPQDRNGPYVKFYDARTGGGFDLRTDIAPCAAADECHGAGAQPAPASVIASGADLGAGDNVAAPATKPHRKAKHPRRRKRHHRYRGRQDG